MHDEHATTHDRHPPGDAPARRALLSGGGTGGHVFPALAIGDALRERGWRVSYAGSAHGVEARLAVDHGLPFHPLPARPVVGRGLAGKARALATLVRSSLAARSLIRRLDARVVVGTGGYVAAPAVVGGWLARRPVILVEPNAAAGLANRALSRLAAEAAIAFPETAAELRCPATVTGVPVRAAFFDVPGVLPPAPPWRLLVLGGSQGARQINELVPAALARRGPGAPPIVLRHQCGTRHLDAVRAAWATPPAGVEVEITPFVDDVAGAMAESHLVISRAGAITVAELSAAGRPSILIPLALAGGHQADNAATLERAGAARVLAGDAATPETLAARLDELFDDRARLQEMADAARERAKEDAAAAIAARVEALTGGAR